MSVNVVLNGVTYSVPEPGDSAWGQDLTDYFVAQASGLLQKAGGTFTLTAEVDFGATYGLKSTYYKTRGTNPATAGQFRLANAESISWRNAANGANLDLKVNASNLLEYNGTAIASVGNYITALTGDVVATGPGSVAATIQPDIITNAMVNSAAAIVYSKLNLSNSILNADINASAAIDFSKLAALTSGNILVGNVSNVAASVAVSGDVTISNAGVVAIGANKVTNGMLAQVATATFKGRTTGGTGDVEDLTVSQATALLNAFVGDAGAGGTKGLVPAPAAGDAASGKVLKADGTWGAAGTASPLTTKGDLYTYTTVNARHGVPDNYGYLVPDSGQSDGWRNAPFTAVNGRPSLNYIQYADFENNATTGWSLGVTGALTNGLPTTTPTFGSGASGNLSIAATATTPLSGTYSLSLVSSAATTAGNCLASDAFTIFPSAESKVMQIKFNYSAISNPTNGNFSGTSSNSFAVAIYDVTNSAWIIPAGAFNFVQNSGVGTFTGTFQTSSNGTSYRLVIYNANATSGAITMYFDDLYVGPQITAAGAAISDWTAYTPTITGLGTPTNVSYWYKIVGDSIQVSGSQTSGTAAASIFSITLPSGRVLDTAKIGLANTTAAAGPHFGTIEFSNSDGFGVIVTATGTSTSLVYMATRSSLVPKNGSDLSGNGVVGTVNFTVPIAGLSSNTVMSNDTDTRIVELIATGQPANMTAGNPIIYPTASNDTHGAYNATTGIYTVPVSGFYKVTANGVSTVAATALLKVYKNSAEFKTIGSVPIANSLIWGSGDVPCVAGDTLYVTCDNNMTSFSATAGRNSLSITRVSGPATVAASEKVYLKYTGNAGGGTTANVTNLDFTTKVQDSHSAWNGTTFTAPKTGWYNVAGLANFTASIGNVISGYKNASVDVAYGYPAASTTTFPFGGAIYLLAGDALTIRGSASATLSNSATLHWIGISSQE